MPTKAVEHEKYGKRVMLQHWTRQEQIDNAKAAWDFIQAEIAKGDLPAGHPNPMDEIRPPLTPQEIAAL